MSIMRRSQLNTGIITIIITLDTAVSCNDDGVHKYSHHRSAQPSCRLSDGKSQRRCCCKQQEQLARDSRDVNILDTV